MSLKLRRAQYKTVNLFMDFENQFWIKEVSKGFLIDFFCGTIFEGQIIEGGIFSSLQVRVSVGGQRQSPIFNN